jgi:hypothetical protein
MRSSVQGIGQKPGSVAALKGKTWFLCPVLNDYVLSFVHGWALCYTGRIVAGVG